MAEMKFNVGQAETAKGQFMAQSTKLNSIISSLGKDINQVESWWKGDSQSVFIAQYRTFEPSLKELSDLAKRIADQMKKIADIKKQEEAKIASMFK
jgi:WXG100 family type VII secretion target